MSFPKVENGISNLLKCRSPDEAFRGHSHFVCGGTMLPSASICRAPGQHVLGRQILNQICEHFFFLYWRYNPLWVCILQPSSGL
jgi:hypothetical protein